MDGASGWRGESGACVAPFRRFLDDRMNWRQQ
jgi:hypothetical protein